MWYKNIAGGFFGLVTKHVCGRRKDRITTPQEHASIAASRGKNGGHICQLSACKTTSGVGKTGNYVSERCLTSNPTVMVERRYTGRKRLRNATKEIMNSTYTETGSRSTAETA